MSPPALGELLSSLQVVALERRGADSFRPLHRPPDWFLDLCPEATGEDLRLGARFPFLEHFLAEAEEFWRAPGVASLKSGPWRETAPSGREFDLEATAAAPGATPVLLITALGAEFEERRQQLQRARENRLAHEKLNREIQKKEILLHCIVHDLASPLMGIKAGYYFIDAEKLSAQERQFLEIAKGQSERLEKMIREILDAFRAEIASLEAFSADPAAAPDVAACARDVIQGLAPACALQQVTLRFDPEPDLTDDWVVTGEYSRLERVIANLAENALRHSPPGSTVRVSLSREGGEVRVAIDDEGPGVAPELAPNLFQKFVRGRRTLRKAGLGLYFCRITVEHRGGAIGYEPRPAGGSRFWFRLPQPTPA
jgi:signal transduction histidine kinase